MIAENHTDYMALAERYDADFNPHLPRIIIERGEGVILTDVEGHQSIDMSEITASIGHCHPGHVAAVQQAAAQMITGKGSETNPSRARLIAQLVALSPANLNKVFLATSGSEIVEWAMRIARRHTGRHEIISFWGGVYGRTYGAMSMNGLVRRRRRFGPVMPGVIHAPYPYCYRCPFDKDPATCDFYCITFLDRVLEAESTDDVAALVVEPYQGVGGIIFPPEGYLPHLQAWAAERHITFVLDEVQSAFGRTGKMFAHEWEHLQPNMLCLGKGLGGGISIAALVAESEIIASLLPGELGGGNGGNPLACTSALKVVDIIRQEKLCENAVQVGEYLLGRMRQWQNRHAIIGDVRGRGLCLALEFVKDRQTREPLRDVTARVADLCYANGVYISGGSHIFSLRPPLVITLEQAEQAANVIEAALDQVDRELTLTLIVDAHTHLGLEEFVVKPISAEKRARPAFRDRMGNRIEDLVRRMDADGVSMAVAFPYPLEEVDPVLANEYVLQAHRAYPDRIIPFALVGDDVEHWLARGARGFKQHAILQAAERFDLPRAYRQMAEAGVPLVLHARSREPLQVTAQVHEILRSRPALKVIVAHMGRNTPNTGEHVETNLAALVAETNVYFDTSTVRDPAVLARAVDLVGDRRILFGSDFPFNSYQDPDPLAVELAVVTGADLAPHVRQRILGENLLQLLGIGRDTHPKGGD